jgi:hypothetical protein
MQDVLTTGRDRTDRLHIRHRRVFLPSITVAFF